MLHDGLGTTFENCRVGGLEFVSVVTLRTHEVVGQKTMLHRPFDMIRYRPPEIPARNSYWCLRIPENPHRFPTKNRRSQFQSRRGGDRVPRIAGFSIPSCGCAPGAALVSIPSGPAWPEPEKPSAVTSYSGSVRATPSPVIRHSLRLSGCPRSGKISSVEQRGRKTNLPPPFGTSINI